MVAPTTKLSVAANSTTLSLVSGLVSGSSGGGALAALRPPSQISATTKTGTTNSPEIGLRFGAAVTLDLSVTSPNAPQAIQDELKIVNQIKQQNIDAKVNNPKADARKKLDLAIKQLALLKILQPGLKSAGEAAKIAKTVSDAAKEYAAAERAAATIDPSDLPTGAPSGNAGLGPSGTSASDPSAVSSSDTPARVENHVTDPTQNTASTPTTTGTSASQPPLPEDPFFKIANGVLGELKKYLRKTLPPLLTSPDRKTRESAAKIRDEFNKSVNESADAEQNFNDARPAAIANGLDTAPAADSDPSASTDSGAGQGITTQATPINLTV